MSQIATSLRKRSGGRHALFVWLTLAALFLQSLVTQTHVHLPSRFLPISVRGPAVSAGFSIERPAPAGDRNCPLCIELKAAGHYLPATPVVLIAPPAFAFWFYRMATVEPTRPQATHHWQSRAPPRQPQI